MTFGILGSSPNPEGDEEMSFEPEDSKEMVREEPVKVEEESFILKEIKEIPTKTRDTPLVEKTRYRIATGLFIALSAIIGLTTVRLLFFSNPLSDQSLDFIKWSVGILGSLFGTAMGFYFGGKR